MINDILSALQSGRLADAERLSRTALMERPDDADLLLFLAIALQQQGRLSEALELYQTLARAHPDDSIHWGNYATALREAGRRQEAEAAYRQSIALAPDNLEQLANLGLLQLEQKDFPAARDTFLRAHALDPASPAMRIHAARACSACRDSRAEELIRPWRSWTTLDDPLQLELADLQLVLGEANIARVLLEELLTRTPGHLPAQLLLAAVYERINDLDASTALLDRVERTYPTLDDEAQLEIVHQRAKLALRRGQTEQARRMLQQCGPRTPDDYAHFFTLAETCDKLRDYPGAIEALREAHARQIEELRINAPRRFDPGAPVLPAAVERIGANEFRRWPTLQAPDGANSPVFIVGFPRSGTTLLEQMLDAHPALQSMDERPFFTILSDQLADHGIMVPQDLHKLDQHACDELRKGYVSLVCSKIQRRWSAQLVDKNPLNMLWLPLIYRLFPEAKFILALRHPCDVLVSNYMQNFRAAVLAVACASMEKLATAYVTAMECWLHDVALFQPNVFVSRYEDLVADPAAQTRRIADFLGLEDASPLLHFDQHARDKGFIATPSYAQVTQPVNRKGLDRWKRYREALAPALPILDPMLRHWGYSVADADESAS
ncbi:MAG TPA: sulfotransferase [Dyella sp.]|nr:sulfotransferase [Dyella sp.]